MNLQNRWRRFVRRRAQMETSQVRYFLTLCEEQSFTRTAKRCGVSQPSVSNAIRRLEEELGGSLFHRTRGGTKLSALGAAMRPYLNQIDRCSEAARRKAETFPNKGLVSTHTTMERSMRKIIYSAAIAAGVIVLAVTVGHLPHLATASQFTANGVDVRALEATTDVKALPQQSIAPEAYQ
jgi:molybdenum-dependent DNA-binding transcriptional regulator ModE